MGNKAKRDKLIQLINAKLPHDKQLTLQQVNTGLVPGISGDYFVKFLGPRRLQYAFSADSSSNFSEKYNLVDTFMLSRRFEEEIYQTKREMANHLKSLITVRDNLTNDINVLG